MKVLTDSTLDEHPILKSPYDLGSFGCCGARYVDNPEDFNNFNDVPLTDHWDAYQVFRQYNRGILLGRNIKPNEIKSSDNSIVESFVVGEETFFVRIRK